MVRGGHRNGRPRQAGNALFRVAACDLHTRRQQHADVEAARRVAHEVKLPRLEAARAEHFAAQRVGAPRDGGRRLRRAADDARLDATPTERMAERLLHVLEVAHRADGREAEEARYEENESCRHDRIVPNLLYRQTRRVSGVPRYACVAIPDEKKTAPGWGRHSWVWWRWRESNLANLRGYDASGVKAIRPYHHSYHLLVPSAARIARGALARAAPPFAYPSRRGRSRSLAQLHESSVADDERLAGHRVRRERSAEDGRLGHVRDGGELAVH